MLQIEKVHYKLLWVVCFSSSTFILHISLESLSRIVSIIFLILSKIHHKK